MRAVFCCDHAADARMMDETARHNQSRRRMLPVFPLSRAAGRASFVHFAASHLTTAADEFPLRPSFLAL
jgi:hypothetical protein